MLKVVVFDCGYGGELLADELAEVLPILEIIRVIDWRHASEIQSSPRRARECAREALRPYIGKVDLIIFANHLLSVTSLKYFQRKYNSQRFLGLKLKSPDSYVKRDVLVLATKPLAKTLTYQTFLLRLRRNVRTLTPDSWPAKIDDGLLTAAEVRTELARVRRSRHFDPKEVILACSQFSDLKPTLRDIFGHNLKIYDSFNDAINQTYKILKIRGGLAKKSK